MSEEPTLVSTTEYQGQARLLPEHRYFPERFQETPDSQHSVGPGISLPEVVNDLRDAGLNLPARCSAA